MAVDLEKTVKIIFAGEDEISKTIASIGKGFDTLGYKLSGATQPLADFTDSILMVDGVLLALAAGGLAIATKSAGEFADGFNEIATLIEAPTQQLDDFKQSILDYSRDSTASMDEIQGSIYQIVSATGDWENSLKTLEAAERLNVAGVGQLDSTTKLLVTSLNAFGKGADDAADFADILFTGVRVGVTNLTELSASLGTVTGLAASAGVPFDDLTAAVSALTGTVGDTSLAVTQVKGVLTAVIKPSEQAKKAADDLGISFDAATLSSMGLDKFLRMVYDAADGNTTILSKLFGRVEGLNGALVLGADTSGKYAEALDGMANRAGAVDAAFEKMANNFANVNQKIINNLQATLIDVGTPLLDDWAAVAEGLNAIFQGLSIGINADAFKPVYDAIDEFSKNASEFLKGVGEALPEALAEIDWSGLEEAFAALAEAAEEVFTDIFGDIDLTKPEDLQIAIQKVVTIIEKLIWTTAGIVEGLGPFIEQVVKLANNMLELDGDTFKVVGQISGIGKAVNVAANEIPKLTGALQLLQIPLGILAVTQIPSFIASLFTMGGALAPLLPLLGEFGLWGGAALSGYAFGKVVYENSETVRQFGDFLGETAFRLVHWGQTHETVTTAQLENAKATEALTKKAALLAAEIDSFDELAKPTVDVSTNFESVQHEWESLNKEFEAAQKDITIKAKLDTSEVKKNVEYIKILLEDPITGLTSEINVPVKVKPDEKSVDDTKKKIEAATPAERITIAKIDNETEVEVARIKAHADTLQSAFEWTAKVEIADLEASAKRVEAIAQGLTEAFASTGETIVGLVGALNEAEGYAALTITQAIEEESARRNELLVMQKELTQAEIDLTNTRNEKLKAGAGLISIEASGVYPELELVLEKIIERAQIQANAEGIAFLLGA